MASRRHSPFVSAMCGTMLLHTIAAFSSPPHGRLFSTTHRKIAFAKKKRPFTNTQLLFVPHMTLLPLPVDKLERLLVLGAPTAAQYSTYWGRSSREKYGALLEASIVTMLGMFMSYFMSFVLGGFVASILGSLCAMWIILSPELRAYQRNWELRAGRTLVDPWSVDDNEAEDKQGLYGALFLGRIKDVCVVEEASSTEEYDLNEFLDYSMETDELEKWTGNPYLLRVEMQDQEGGRDLQVHSRMSEEYLDLQIGQPILGVLLSTSQKFSSLAALTDFYVPDASCWIGDYPYLDRDELEQLLAQDDNLWDVLESQRVENEDATKEYYNSSDIEDYKNDDFDDESGSDRYVKLPIRRQRR